MDGYPLGSAKEGALVATVGIDIGGLRHVVACWRNGHAKADREVLRMSQSRAGFAALDTWLERQPEPVLLVTIESSSHYWMPLASHLRRREAPVAVVNPLAAKYFAKSRLAQTKSDPADARSPAEMGMRDQPAIRNPLADVELRQADPFATTLVEEQAKVCQRLIRLVALGFPELGELFDDPACRKAREVLRIAPMARAATRRLTSTLANANGGPGHRRLGTARAERLQVAAADSIAVPGLDAEVAFEVGVVLDQYDLLERQIDAADTRVASLLDGETARRLRTIPGVGPQPVHLASARDRIRAQQADPPEHRPAEPAGAQSSGARQGRGLAARGTRSCQITWSDRTMGSEGLRRGCSLWWSVAQYKRRCAAGAACSSVPWTQR
jgi:transposase